MALCEADKDVVIVDADNKLDAPQTNEILQFFAERTWPWPRENVRAGLILKKKEMGEMPFTAAQVRHWPLREPFGTDEYFTTLMIGEKMSKQDLKIRHHAS